MPRAIALVAVAVALVAFPLASDADARRARYEVELLCEGQPCPETRHRRQRWVMGAYQERYSIVVRNPTDRWVEAVITVDGRDVVNGSRGTYDNRGYLLEPYGRIEVDGWRVSTREVAAFRFTSVPDSYAGRVDGGPNAGVIGVAFFPERRRRAVVTPRPIRPTPEPYDRRSGRIDDGDAAAERSSDAPSAGTGGPSTPGRKASAMRERRARQRMGTAYGEHRASSVYEVDFRRARQHRPDRVVTLRYDDRAGLLARGISPPPPRYVPPPRPYVAPEPWPERPYTPPPPPRWDDRWVPPPPEPFPGG